MAPESLLIVRIGAMGDIIHALPAVASLQQTRPQRSIAWLIAPQWMPLLAGNPFVDRLIPFRRDSFAALRDTYKALRAVNAQDAIDFQGLIKSALAARAARPQRVFGFVARQVRERPAAWLYTDRVAAPGPHRVQQNLQLASAAGAKRLTAEAWLPPGEPEGSLPPGPYILTTPFAGWKAKEWPLQHLNELGRALRSEGLTLLANIAPSRAHLLRPYPYLQPHSSSLSGLIYAVRQAAAVIAPDSGPLHLAAALQKPGVGLFGPTDPVSHGPFGGTITVLRAPTAATTYKRDNAYHPSMLALTVDQVKQALLASLSSSISK